MALVDQALERPGPNELLEEALERIRGTAEAPPSFAKEGAIVVVKRDEGGEALARVLEVNAAGLVRVRRIDRYGEPIGRRTWMLVPGELVRLAIPMHMPRGKTRYATSERALVTMPPGPGELPEGVEAA